MSTLQPEVPDENDVTLNLKQASNASLTTGTARIPRIPSPNNDVRRVNEKVALQREASRLKNPHNAVRMTTVTMSARLVLTSSCSKPDHSKLPNFARIFRAKDSSNLRRSYDESLRRPQKVISMDEALSARPPLPFDLDGPTPCSYSPHHRKPLRETNAPAWSFGRKTFVEKGDVTPESFTSTQRSSKHV